MSEDNPSTVVVIRWETPDFTTSLTPAFQDVRAFQTIAEGTILQGAIDAYASSLGTVSSSWASRDERPTELVVTYVDNNVKDPLPIDTYVRGLQHAITSRLLAYSSR